MAASHPLPIDVLRQLIRLDPETGRLYWADDCAAAFAQLGARTSDISLIAQSAGREFGGDHLGYRRGSILGHRYMAHRIAFALFCGRWPTGEVDHINGNRADNRPCNLREATHAENSKNQGARRGTSQYCGVHWHRAGKAWCAYCQNGSGKQVYLGLFPSEEAAARAYDRAAREWHGEFARPNFPN